MLFPFGAIGQGLLMLLLNGDGQHPAAYRAACLVFIGLGLCWFVQAALVPCLFPVV